MNAIVDAEVKEKPKTIYLKDYQTPAYEFEKVNLSFVRRRTADGRFYAQDCDDD
jgi:hypothetical protein